MWLSLFAVACVYMHFASGNNLHVGHWNVYWKALGDSQGRQAIIKAIDDAAGIMPFDFFSINEAAGPSGDGAASFPDWLNKSAAFGPSSDMLYMSGKSGHETIALLYHGTTWQPVWWKSGEFQHGRPYVLALFSPRSGSASKVWVVSAHTPHYPQTWSFPGQDLVAALNAGAGATKSDITDTPLIIMGDFNEFGECSLPPDIKCTSIPKTVLGPLAGWAPFWYHATSWAMAPLWNLTAIADAVPFNTTTCCTKWYEGEVDWRHHFDHIFYSTKHFTIATNPTLIPYTYPTVEDSCSTPACTGDNPPGGSRPQAQGSWHRGWQAAFNFHSEVSDLFA